MGLTPLCDIIICQDSSLIFENTFFEFKSPFPQSGFEACVGHNVLNSSPANNIIQSIVSRPLLDIEVFRLNTELL